MNKSGQTEILFFFLFIIGIVGFIGYSIINSNPYTTYINDCESLFKENFTEYNQTCYSFLDENKTQGYDCEITDKKELLKFCQNKYDANYTEGEQQ